MRLLSCSIGKKVVMAASGLMLFGFVIAHLLGNLMIFSGPDALNGYAHHVRDFGPWLWLARGALLLALIAHVATSIQLSRENRAARPQPYRMSRYGETTLAARTMLLSGGLLLAYLMYHLLHFTFRVTNPELSHAIDRFGHAQVYAMVVRSFQIPAISFTYLLAMTLLWLHLMHGLGSAAQTLGLNNERTLRAVSLAGRAIALGIFAGYCSIPIGVLFGIIR